MEKKAKGSKNKKSKTSLTVKGTLTSKKGDRSSNSLKMRNNGIDDNFNMPNDQDQWFIGISDGDVDYDYHEDQLNEFC